MVYQRYTPRRPVKSFQDLEIYQMLLAAGVEIVKRLEEDQGSQKEHKNPESEEKSKIQNKLLGLALELPRSIAQAHSTRFVDMKEALGLLDEIMHGCNQVVVLLEQYRDLCSNEIEHEFFEERTQSYLRTRWKVMHLARSWEKFAPPVPTLSLRWGQND